SPKQLADDWIPTSLAWLKRTRGRLVVSCRLDAWDSLYDGFSRHLPSRGHTKDASSLVLDDFSETEAAEAAERYGLNAEVSNDLRHPLFFRLGAQLEDPTAASSEARGMLLEEYCNLKRGATARALSLPTALVENLLNRFGQATLSARSFGLPQADAIA